MIQHRLKRYFVYLVIVSSFGLVFINEFLIYALYRFSWNSIRCRSANCTTVLLVADPQIIGETFDENFYNSIAIHDSDRYLKNTFVRAFAFAKPDVVCFMGDLMDEGSVASPEAYQRYLNRFNYIFKTSAHVHRIHIPGDNDIGGERSDYVTAFKLNRFREAFNETNAIVVRDRFRFLNINMLTHKYPDLNQTDTVKGSRLMNIILTHIPILSYPGLSMKTVIDQFKPSVIFSAHMHLSRVITYPPQEVENLFGNQIVKVDLRGQHAGEYKKFTEIMIPTSSYRMGVNSIGYGFAVIDFDELQYTVLWSPDRFKCLFSYAIWFGLVFAWLCVWAVSQNSHLCKRRVTYRIRQRLMIATDKF